ncbi:MAG: T9SS type A sorting domain-containing protein [Flavobacteriaceae bacterium]
MRKTLLVLATFIFVCFSTHSQTTFNKTQSIALPSGGGNAPYNIASGLIDNDAFPDIVVSTTLGNSVYWLKNDGLGTFTVQSTPISSTLNSAGGVAIADLNGDGFNDVVTTSYNDNKLVWFANDGSGNFGTEQLISSSVSGPSQVYVRQFDNNATLDVSVSSYSGNEVVWFSNDGSGNFGTKNIIDNTIVSPGAYAVKDIDFDGDIDAVIGNSVAYGVPNDCRIEVFYNDGNGVFTADTNPVSVNTKDYIFSIMAEDVDADNSLDILVTDINGSPSWFKRTQISPGTATYTETVLSTSIANPACLDLQDLDNDNLKDFVLSSATSGAGNDIVWFKNNGAGGFNSELVIDATQSQAYTFTFADFENDGDLDIASIAYNDDDVNIFNNQKITLSINDAENFTPKIFPNPASSKLYLNDISVKTYKVSIYDLLGKKIFDSNLSSNLPMDISTLKSGIYFLRFDRLNKILKFIKQ